MKIQTCSTFNSISLFLFLVLPFYVIAVEMHVLMAAVDRHRANCGTAEGLSVQNEMVGKKSFASNFSQVNIFCFIRYRVWFGLVIRPIRCFCLLLLKLVIQWSIYVPALSECPWTNASTLMAKATASKKHKSTTKLGGGRGSMEEK